MEAYSTRLDSVHAARLDSHATPETTYQWLVVRHDM